jgi:hypothetical protein
LIPASERPTLVGVRTIAEVLEYRPPPWERDVVVRRIGRPFSELCVADLVVPDALRFTGPLMPDDELGAHVLRAPAVIRLRATTVSAVVEVQVVEWSSRISELRIVPRSHFVELWTEHRRRRYFDLVHDAADSLARVLDCRPLAA